jgi:hypothetical protein
LKSLNIHYALIGRGDEERRGEERREKSKRVASDTNRERAGKH